MKKKDTHEVDVHDDAAAHGAVGAASGEETGATALDDNVAHAGPRG